MESPSRRISTSHRSPEDWTRRVHKRKGAQEEKGIKPDLAREAETIEFPFFSSEASTRKNILVSNLRSDKYRLRQNLPVHLHEENGESVAVAHDLNQYGTGPSEEDALEHLCSTIVEYYEMLTEEREKLSKQLKGHLAFMSDIIETKNATKETGSP